MRITFFGIGYVGLVQAAVFAEAGYQVMCVDIDQEKIAHLKAGTIPIYEPGLEALVSENIRSGHLVFTSDPKEGVAFSPLQFIAVGTPPDEDGSADLRHVLTVARTIAQYMEQHKTIVVKSTVPVGTSDKVRAALEAGLKQRGGLDLGFAVASNPEFLKEGSAVADCMKPDRIIIGTDNLSTEKLLRELYAPFNRNHEKIIAMDIRSAELTKYAANCMLATKISFMNEMANLADRFGADIEKVRVGIGADPRIGYHFIYPGVGYGGSCFPKDVRATIRTAEADGFDPILLKAVEARNELQKSFLVDKILKRFDGDIRGRTFALWGLAFKPKTDDMRDAPSRVVMEALWQAGARVQAYDPAAMDECRGIYGDRSDLLLCESKDATLNDADALVVVTEWKQFHAPDFAVIKAVLREPVIFDGRNLYDPAMGQRHGLEIYSVGRLPHAPG